MKKYISKDALVAEIKRRFDEYSTSILKHYDACKEAKAQELGKILIILDTLEVKEIDFHKELLSFYRHTNDSGSGIALAKHFYELGLKAAQNEHKSCTTDE